MSSGHPYHFQSLLSKTGHCSVSFCGSSRPATLLWWWPPSQCSLCLRQIWPSADLTVSAFLPAKLPEAFNVREYNSVGGLVEGRGWFAVGRGEGGGFCTITSLTIVDVFFFFFFFFFGGGVGCGGEGNRKTILNRNVSLKALKWLGNCAGSPSNGSVPTIWGCPCEPLDGRATTWLWLNVGISHVSETGRDVNHLLVVITLAQLSVYNHLGQNVSNFNLYLAPGMRRGRLWLH